MASKKRESKSDRKRMKLEKKRRKLEKKLREVEARLKKNDLKRSEDGELNSKPRANSGAARSASKQATRLVPKIETAPKKTARKARKPAPAAKRGSKSEGRPKRARSVPPTTGVDSTRGARDTSPAADHPASG